MCRATSCDVLDSAICLLMLYSHVACKSLWISDPAGLSQFDVGGFTWTFLYFAISGEQHLLCGEALFYAHLCTYILLPLVLVVMFLQLHNLIIGSIFQLTTNNCCDFFNGDLANVIGRGITRDPYPCVMVPDDKLYAVQPIT